MGGIQNHGKFPVGRVAERWYTTHPLMKIVRYQDRENRIRFGTLADNGDVHPITGDLLGLVDDSRRSYRWMFHALHSFDFQLLLKYRPAWDIVVILLSILGTIVSVSGVVVGWRYLKR